MNIPAELENQDRTRHLNRDRKSIARMSSRQQLSPAQAAERGLIHPSMKRQADLDGFRHLRTRLLSMMDGNFTTLVVPVSRNCGGSFVTRNLAAAFALDSSKTALIVDCDLRSPSQQSALHVDAVGGGLTDYLEDEDSDIGPRIYDTGCARLRLIPSGSIREAGTEYFTSIRMRLLLDELRSRYQDRYVFLDGPPVTSNPDARILADHADMVILVAGYGRDTPEIIAQAASSFEPAKFAGVVFNNGG